jgi:hypothetical protein
LIRPAPRAVALVLVVVAVAGCGGTSGEGDAGRLEGSASRPAGDGGEWFVDAAVETGLAFTHVNGTSGTFYDAEIFAPGAALLDFDNDGDLDVYLVQGRLLAASADARGSPAPPAGPSPPGDRLFRNDLTVLPDGSRTLRFTDVTAQSGIDVTTYGMGAAAGDIDNDGWIDLYLTRLGRNVLLHNNGNGTFTDVSRRSGTDDPSWSVSAAFADVDRDGWLDLYVGNYLEYSVDADRMCTTLTGKPDYCPPGAYRPVADRLYLNQRDGTFRDTSARAGIAGSVAPALGVSTADFDGDGWIDIYVANDSMENLLWINQRDGSFRDMALISGAAVDAAGDAEASMGVDAGDFDNDGDDDLVIANITAEGHTLYGNDGKGAFEDWGARSGLRPASLRYTGFGAAWLDADNDGWLDVLTVNGAVRLLDGFSPSPDAAALHQRPQLFRNLANGRFEDASARAGAVFAELSTGRGAAYGDVDNDGDVDVVVGNNNGPAQLLLNQAARGNHWVGLAVVDRSGRPALGAKVGVVLRDGRTLWRRARSDGSYASANDPRVVVGLGASTDIARLRIIWPDGRAEEWTGVAVDRWTTLREGTATSTGSR